MPRLPAAKLAIDEAPLELEFGATLPRLEIAYETWGELSPERNNAILVCPAFSASSHARSSPSDPSAGWWEKMIGVGAALDSDRFFVICASLLGGGHGTSGPLTEQGEAAGPWRGDFPVVSISDIARCHLRLLDALDIEELHAVIGGSMGAMQALQIGIHHSERANRVITISGTDRTRPAAAAIRHIGRKAIMSDPEYNDGHYEGNGPEIGLRLAREIGTVFYRSKHEFNERFRWQAADKPVLDGITFEVQSYLEHQGKKIIGKFDANTYLRLSMAMDLFDLARGFPCIEELASQSSCQFFIAGVEEDRLIPIVEQRGLHQALIEGGCRSHWLAHSSPVGHDAFLVDAEELTPPIAAFLDRA